MPLLSHMFHLSPADVWNLAQDELETYLKAAEEYTQRMEEAVNG